jgi:glycosyltransferase involved in cell wall biosynthesis
MPLVTPHGKIDGPGEGVTVERDVHSVSGWALFPNGPVASVEVFLGEESLGRARVGLPRPDLDLPRMPFAETSGFELSFDLNEWSGPDGRTAVRAIATGLGGERHELPPVNIVVSSKRPERKPPKVPPPAQRTPRPSRGSGLRVLVVTHQLNLGGAQLYLMDVLKELLRQEAVEPTVVAFMDGELRLELEELGVPVHISSLIPLDDLSTHVGRVEELAHWAKERDFEVAFINTITGFSTPGGEVAELLGIPAVWAIHESFSPAMLWLGLDPVVRDRFEAALGNAACAIFEAEATQRLFESSLRQGAAAMLPYGLDFAPIDEARVAAEPKRDREALGIPHDATVAVCVGTIEPRKAQLPLAQAFSLIGDQYPQARLVFVGGKDDAESEALADYIEISGFADRIELIPVTPDVHRWYGVADVLVSASDIESLPRTVLEAMAWEIPVLATNVFGLPEIVEDGVTGWLCEPRDTFRLADGLERALSSSREERVEIGRRARQLVQERHSLERYGRQVSEILQQAITDWTDRAVSR